MKHTLLLIFSSLLVFKLAAQIPNAGFENWNSDNGYENPNNYSLLSNDVYKGIDAMSGGLTTHPLSVTKVTGRTGNAISLKNIRGTGLGQIIDTLPAFAVIGDVASGTQGIPFTQKPTSLKGYYKFTQGSTQNVKDTATIAVWLTKSAGAGAVGDSIGGGILKIYQTAANFTAFTINITYTNTSVTPDTLYLGFITSSDTSDNAKVFPNTELVVDDLSLTGVTGVKHPLFANNGIIAYPNPASDNLNFKNLPEEASLIEIRDFTGRIIKSLTTQHEFAAINISELPVGIYNYSVVDSEGNTLYADKFNVAK